MFACLASLLFLAVGEVAPPPPVPDAEVAPFLKTPELAEWNNALRLTAAGETRVKTGQSIMAMAATKSAAPGPQVGSLAETPEQAKARAQKVIDEGTRQLQQALPSLTRLRLAAAVRSAEANKPILFQVESAQKAWEQAVTQGVARLQKQASDAGFTQTHFLGGFALLGDNKLSRPAALAGEIRAAWSKVDERSLAPIPEGGYSFTPAVGKAAPTVAKTLTAAAAPKQIALVWAEFYALSSDGNMGLLFLRLADAQTMHIIGSALAFTELGAKTAVVAPLNCAITLQDQRSFLPRLGSSGEWLLGFERSSHPLGSALLTHLCVTQSKVQTAAAPYVVIVAGGGPAGAEGIRARWNVAQAESDGTFLAFNVSSVAEGAAALNVGTLKLVVSAPTPAK